MALMLAMVLLCAGALAWSISRSNAAETAAASNAAPNPASTDASTRAPSAATGAPSTDGPVRMNVSGMPVQVVPGSGNAIQIMPTSQPGAGAVVTHGQAISPTPGGLPASGSPPAGGSLLPPEYAILNTRNLFGPPHAAPAGPAGPEAGFVFKGVIQSGSAYTAFIEQVNSKQVMQLSVGDPIARGKIKSIDLDGIEYAVGADSHRITVGQNLMGMDVPVTAPANPPNGNGPPGNGGQRGGRGRGGPNGMPQGAMPPGVQINGMPPGAMPNGPPGADGSD
jgi:hypothetical protein